MHFIDSITLPTNFDSFSEIIDVRSPEEFAIDHIPGAINLPVMNNREREEVGTLYKDSPFEARRLGASYVSANASQYLREHLRNKPSDYAPLLYCWRGGMRSRSFTFILNSIGWKAKVVYGGYRAFRKLVVDELDTLLERNDCKLTVLSGLTGVGKTRLLHALDEAGQQVLDLEGLANHKGSLLGNPTIGSQPTQKHFETQLWNTFRKFDFNKPIFTEAESNRIGKLHCPTSLWKQLGDGSVINIELPIEERAKLLRQDYPHFCDNPESLMDLLNVLVRIRGHEQVELWKQQILQQDWDNFLTSILRDHYDLSYRRPGDEKANYSAPVSHIQLPNCEKESYQKAVATLTQ